jgi:phthiocerol/phenolphthiocerol synthesis type-I polyketide synthase E
MRRAMTNEEGIEVIHRVLGQWRGAQIFTSTVDLDAYAGSTSDIQNNEPVSTVALSSAEELDGLNSIIHIWRDLLGVDSVGPSDNFFDLGGHSLMATMMISRIREQLGVTLSLRDIFEAQTPERLSDFVRRADQRVGINQPQFPEDQERELFEI